MKLRSPGRNVESHVGWQTAMPTVSMTQVRIEIPPEYQEFCEVFSKATSPCNHIYPLSAKESQAMEEYIDDTLKQGYIHPSTSPASASFFVEKKGHGLWPCINYHWLNQVTVKYHYPLPLVPAVLEQLREAKIFIKLNL